MGSDPRLYDRFRLASGYVTDLGTLILDPFGGPDTDGEWWQSAARPKGTCQQSRPIVVLRYENADDQ